jgi:hypothetical protein
MNTTRHEVDNDLTVSDDPPIPVESPDDPEAELLADPAETARKNEYVPETFG